jgi:hypothetical protein
MHQSFHRELAYDRQRQLVRDRGMAPQLAALRASERAELEADRRQALRFEPGQASVLAVLARRVRGAFHVRPLGA